MTIPAPACFSRCDRCRSVLPVPVHALADAGGMVRCGHCGRTLNALACLFDHPPTADEVPLPSSGMPPMLDPQEAVSGADPDSGADVDVDLDVDIDVEHDDPGETPEPHLGFEPEAAPSWDRTFWPALSVLLVAALSLQLFGPQRWRLDPAMLGLGSETAVALGGALHLVSRDMHPHPSVDEAIIVSAVVQNRSDRRVAWPNIDVRLFDVSQQLVGQRRLRPRDYLDPETDPGTGLAPGSRLPVVLEMMIESSRPTGFMMEFHHGE